MSYMLTVAIAFMRGSICAALSAKLPLPQMPSTPILSRVDEGAGAQEIDGGAEIINVDVRRDGIARLALALAPEGQIEGQSDKALFGQLGGIEIGALLLHGAHRVADDDRRRRALRSRFLGTKRLPTTFIPSLLLKVTFSIRHAVAFVEIVGALRHVLGVGRRRLESDYGRGGQHKGERDSESFS